MVRPRPCLPCHVKGLATRRGGAGNRTCVPHARLNSEIGPSSRVSAQSCGRPPTILQHAPRRNPHMITTTI
jgi:hypothetical protein